MISDLGLLIARVAVGIVFIYHGYSKIIAGQQKWLFLGSQMANLGITHMPLVWGILSTVTELFGGVFLVCGFLTRIVVVPLVFNMIVALTYHFNKKDAFDIYDRAFLLLLLCIAFFFLGSGNYSIDGLLNR